jgi:asparagine synthase (glutamine-hydrolysing)
MCGITGYANLDSRAPVPIGARLTLHAMCEAMIHRGPDDEGMMAAPGVGLAMRRLAIIDLLHGEQPAWNEDRTVSVVLNGEIYNYREVRAELEQRGHRFNSASDTEILPHLYEEYGDAMVEKLNGMFAFALWDAPRRRLLIARDRFGEKPLYYGIFDGQLLFASEPKVLLAHPAVQPALNLDALRRYVSFDYVPAPLSIYEGIYKLPAAHTLTLENGQLDVKQYWRLSYRKPERSPTLPEATEQLRALLADAVKMRLVSDVPLGIFLSGGVDSSMVTALAAQTGERIKTFSISFAEASFDESEYARGVADYLGTDHHEERLSVDAAADLIGDIGAWLDEPFSDASIVPTYLLSRFTRRHVTVALGGDGGDELFAGYEMYPGHRWAERYLKTPRFLRRGLIEPLVNLLPVSTSNISFDYKARRFVASAALDDVTRHHSWFGSFRADEHAQLLADDVLRHTDGDLYAEARRLLTEETDATDMVERMQSLDTRLYLAEDILTKVDRATMAVSLEARAPFLDPRVAEFAASLPVDYKLRGRTTKSILKQAAAPLLPPFVVKRPKKGFGVPVADWLKGKLRPLARDLLAPARLHAQGIFNAAYVQRLLDEHEQGRANHRKQLWTLLMFQLWQERFIATRNRVEESAFSR